MTSITNKYTSLSDDELRHKISEISKQFPNSGCLEIIRHLNNLEQPILLQRDRCLKHFVRRRTSPNCSQMVSGNSSETI